MNHTVLKTTSELTGQNVQSARFTVNILSSQGEAVTFVTRWRSHHLPSK
jgi:hypothetical protein